MKRILGIISLLMLNGCGLPSATSKTAQSVATSNLTDRTAEFLVGSYSGLESGSTTACKVNINVIRQGLLRTPYLQVQVEDAVYLEKTSAVNDALAKATGDERVELSTSTSTGPLSSNDSDLLLFFSNGLLDGVHYQAASFSGGIISGQWKVVDCLMLKKN